MVPGIFPSQLASLSTGQTYFECESQNQSCTAWKAHELLHGVVEREGMVHFIDERRTALVL